MLKTREFRAKDFLVRSTHSFERLEMQILYSQAVGGYGVPAVAWANNSALIVLQIHHNNKPKKGCVKRNYSFYTSFLFVRVELVGFEPTSKQGNHMLSTCLFQPSVFVLRQDLDHQSQPYPLKLHLSIEAYTDYFRFTCTA